MRPLIGLRFGRCGGDGRAGVVGEAVGLGSGRVGVGGETAGLGRTMFRTIFGIFGIFRLICLFSGGLIVAGGTVTASVFWPSGLRVCFF